LKLLLLTTYAAFAVAGGGGTVDRAEAEVKCKPIMREITFYKQMTWQFQDARGAPHTKASEGKYPSCEYARWVMQVWMERAHDESLQVKDMIEDKKRELQSLVAERSDGALTNDWICIHNYEGDWNANTGNGYYGGLQMDYDFMQAYGGEFLQRWGTADNWPVWAQVTAANRAKYSYGYSPWPNTARMCGLL
jgi:Transglycosylase-like domain